jgi:hypothetical protein
MNFNEKVAAAKDYLASKGIIRQAYAPTLVTLLWRLGVKVPPPHFAGFAGTFLFVGTFFGTVWGLVMWFLYWSRNGVAPAQAVGYSALAGLVLGLLFASYYRFSARKHGIPRWADFSPAGTQRGR